MKERPILFRSPMVRAILASTKTQTRRLIKPVGKDGGFVLKDYGDGPWPYRSEDGERGFYVDRHGYDIEERIACPYGQPGDRLWVREAWANVEVDGARVVYRADADDDGSVPYLCPGSGGFGGGVSNVTPSRWRPSIHMPRWASRITLEVTDVRVERLQDISEADAIAEGAEPLLVPPDGGSTPHVEGFRSLWESINGPGSWDANPWVWVITFRRITP